LKDISCENLFLLYYQFFVTSLTGDQSLSFQEYDT
jgi:hypothetical protein